MPLRRVLGGIFFVSAGVLLAVTKAPDIFTVLAVAACAVMAGLATTKYSCWSVIGGAAIIAVSLALQAVLFYRCTDCVRADILLLAGVICLSIMERGRFKRVSRVVASAVFVMMAASIALHYPAGAVSAEAVPEEKISRYVNATAGAGEVILDTQVKPVLFFSPTCGACRAAVEELVRLDPDGRTWTPVQASGDAEEGKDFLSGHGYRGSSCSYKWTGPVPAMITTREGSTLKTHIVDEMIEIVRGVTI